MNSTPSSVNCWLLSEIANGTRKVPWTVTTSSPCFAMYCGV